MNDEQVKKIIDDNYDESKEDSIWSMVGDFYNRKMLSFVILLWVWAIIFIVGSVYCGIQFFKAEQNKYLIMYAAGFVCFVHGISLIKIFAWQIIHRNGLRREIKRLEIRIAELNRTVETNSSSPAQAS